jgi:hypothetical protein
MSRVTLSSKNPDHEVVVGWDRPLNSFFISVSERVDEDSLDDPKSLEFRSHWTQAEVVSKIEQYAVDDDRTRRVTIAILAGADPADFVSEP